MTSLTPMADEMMVTAVPAPRRPITLMTSAGSAPQADKLFVMPDTSNDDMADTTIDKHCSKGQQKASRTKSQAATKTAMNSEPNQATKADNLAKRVEKITPTSTAKNQTPRQEQRRNTNHHFAKIPNKTRRCNVQRTIVRPTS